MDGPVTVTIRAEDGASTTFRAIGSSARDAAKDIERIGASGKSLDSLSDRVQALDNELTTVGTGLAAIGATTTAAFGVAVTASMGLESAMANVNSIAGLSESQLAGLTEEVRGLAVELGTSPTDLADALYDIVSSGVDASDAMQVLETSTISAKAGLTDTATSARAVTAVINAYGLEASEAGDISDLLFKTVDSGVVTFEQLANNLGNVLPVAAAIGVEFEEVSAALAEMTLQGISAAQAETGLAAAMRAAINPTEALKDAVEDYGYASVEALIQAEGLVGFLALLEETSGGSSEALLGLLGTSEATTAVLALLSGGVEGFTNRVAEMEAATSDGAYAFGVFQIQSETTAYSIDRAQAALNELSITAGSAVAPAVGFAADSVTSLATAVSLLPEPAQQAAAGVAATAGAVSLLAGGLLLLTPRIVETVRAVRSLGPLLTTLRTSGALGFTAMGGAATIATVAVAGMVAETRNMVQASEDLDEAWRNLKLSGLEDPAADLAEAREEINALIADLGEGSFEWLPFGTGGIEVPQEVKAGISNVLREAVTDSRVDYEEFFAWINNEIARIGDDDEAKIDFLNDLADPDILIDFRSEVDSTTESLDLLHRVATEADQAVGAHVAGEEERAAKAKERIEKLAQAQTDYHQSIMAWLADGANILAWWDDYNTALNTGAAMMDGSIEQMRALEEAAQFRATFDIALDLDQANAAFDQVLRIFDQIDSLGSRTSAAGAIADALFGPDGDPYDAIGPLRDVYDAGRISHEQFLDTIESGIAIQESSARSTLALNEIRADQLPMLEAETLAYEQNLEAIAALGPAEQRRALMLQDTAVQSQIAALYSQAYAASVGEIPQEVATEMILNAAEADAGLKDLLLQLGLITETEGELTVNFPNADATIDAIDRMTIAFLELTAAGSELDAFDIAVNIYGEEEARELFDLVDEADGKEATATVTAETFTAEERANHILDVWLDLDGSNATVTATGVDDASDEMNSIAGLRNALDGSSALVSVFGDNSNAEGAISTTQASLIATNGMSALITVAGDNSSAMAAINEVSAFAGANLGTAVFNVVTQYSSVGSAAGGFFANGGTVWPDDPQPMGRWGLVPQAANGRTVMVGEAGPELVTLPHGSQVTPHAASMSRMESGGGLGGDINININGPVFGIDDLTEQVVRQLTPALRHVAEDIHGSQVSL